MYSIDCQANSIGVMQEGVPIGEILGLGTMRQHFLKASNEMPWCIASLAPLEIDLGCGLNAGIDGGVALSVYAVPDAGIVALLNLSHAGTVAETVDLLDHLTFARDSLLIDGRPLIEIVTECATSICHGAVTLGQDMFHVIDTDSASGVLRDDNDNIPPAPWPKQLDLSIVTKLIYKMHDQVRLDFTSLRMPLEANRHQDQITCVALTGALLYGAPEWFQQSVLGSSIIATAALSRLRIIRRETFDALRQLESMGLGVMSQSTRELTNARIALAKLSERLRVLDIALASGVEAKLDVTAVLPSPTLASYHSATVESMGLTTGSRYVANLVDRLRYSIAAQSDAIAAAERQRDEDRRSEISIVAGALSTVAIVLGIFFGFFGTNSKQVHANYSLFDHRYLGFYLLLLAIILALAGMFLSLRLRRRIRRQARDV
jgi:hypothetical protein